MLAQSYPNARLLLDEERGLGLRVTGATGILLATKAAGLIPAVRPLLDALIGEHDFRLSEALYEQTVRAAGEGE